MDELTKAGLPIQLPDVSLVRYLVEWVNGMGWIEPQGMGMGVLSSTEIKAWLDLNQITPEPWEVDLIKAASAAYLSESNSKSIAPPYQINKIAPSPISKLKALAKQVNK